MWFKTAVEYTRLTGAVVAASIRAAAEYRASFLIQVFGMIINNFGWIVLWGIFFARFPEINGWQFSDTVVLFALATLANGLVLFPKGLVKLSDTISEGGLDSYLSVPRSPLWYAIFSRIEISALGEFLTTAIILVLFTHLTVTQLVLFILTGFIAGLSIFNFLVIVHSVSFWVGNFREGADALYNGLLGFMLYPQTAFSGGLKLVMFTILPAFFIATVPVNVIQNYDYAGLAVVTAFGAGSTLAAWLVWRAGLRRYESGNLINIQG